MAVKMQGSVQPPSELEAWTAMGLFLLVGGMILATLFWLLLQLVRVPVSYPKLVLFSLTLLGVGILTWPSEEDPRYYE